jgi:hypothetical protein
MSEMLASSLESMSQWGICQARNNVYNYYTRLTDLQYTNGYVRVEPEPCGGRGALNMLLVSGIRLSGY